MKEIKNITMYGFGAVGALYGINMWKALGSSFQIVAEGDRKKRYEKEGFIVNGEKITVPVVCPENLTPADFLIIATKNLQIEQAIKQVKKAVGPDTIILSLLNGTDSEERLIEEYGAEKVLYGFCVGMSSIHTANHIDFSTPGSIVFGEADNRRSEQVRAVEKIFETCGIHYKVPSDIRHDQWNKFMLNTAFNTLSSITRGGYGVFAQESMKALSFGVSKEVQAVAAKEGIVLTDSDIQNNYDMMLSLDPNGLTSMCQDMIAGRKTENNWFCGTVVRLGKKHHIETPLCDTLFKIVQGCEKANEMKQALV